ncbi:MAG: DtxR family transcriptional regulator [Anaerolineales bacterium]
MQSILSESLEDYLLNVFEIASEGKVVRINDIAKKSRVRLSSAFNAIKALAEKNLVIHEKYAYIILTDYGIEQAKILYERKKILLKFLTDILHIPEEIAIKDVHKIEHDLSRETLEAIMKFTNTAIVSSTASGGYEIQTMEDSMSLTLKSLKVGEKGKIIAIKKNAGSLKNKLLTMGAVAGTIVKVEKVAPLGDPIDVVILGYHLSLRKEEAEQIVIERL